MGNNQFHHKYKQAKTKRETRGKARKGKAKDTILIICEGVQTEPNYFEGFRLSNVTIDGCGANTDTLVEKAIENLKKYDQIWCVFDRDSFPPQNFNRAFQLALTHNKIKIAYSNEAFELCYLLHFHYYNIGISRSQYQNMLNKLLRHKYQKNSKTMYDELKDKQQAAINHAENLLKTYNPLNPLQNNPSTTVHLLVQELNKYKK